MTNFYIRKLNDKFYVSFRNNQIYVNNGDGSSFNFPEDFYSINSDISFDFRIDSTARANMMEVATSYDPGRMLYDTSKFLAPTILTDAQIIARGQNPIGWKQTYSPVELTISYKINNVVQKYGVSNVEARVKGYGSFLPYNRKMPLRVKSSTAIAGLGAATDITINNMIQSGAKITEHIVYKIYRDYGMLASRTNFIRVFINDSTIKITNINSNTITTNNNHYLFSGMRIKFVGLTGISDDSIFYVISSGRTDTSFKVSETLDGSEYSLPTLSNLNIEYYTDYGEYTNIENLKNIYKINEFFGTNGTTGLYEVGVTTSNTELNTPSSDLYYSREYGSSRTTIDNFLTALSSTSNWYTNFSTYANINQFIKFAVIELLLGQMDGYNTFLNNSYLASDSNGKFNILPWGTDTYFTEDALNGLGWFAYSRFLQQCWADNTALSQFATELIAFNNWLKNNSNIINYANTIFDQKINDFNSDFKKPNDTTSASIISAKNNLINFIQTSDYRVSSFLSRPKPVTNLSGQLVNGNFVMSWDPVTSNVSGQSINNISYEVIILGSTDHKYRLGGYAQSSFGYGMSTSNTTYTVSSGDINSYYSAMESDLSDTLELFKGLYLSVVPKTSGNIWGFAAQPILAKAFTVAPPAPYVPNMKIRVTEVMSNSTAKYGLSSAGSSGPDWFEITNLDTSGISLTGWKMDDDSRSLDFAVSLVPSGWSVLSSGESAVFIETTNPNTVIPAFRQFWNLPSTTKIGYYSGSQLSLSSNGDGVHLFVPSGSSSNSWVYFTGVSFGSAITNRSFYWEYDTNNNIVGTGFSNINYKGGYLGSGQSPVVYATGSPGIYNTGICTAADVATAYTCFNIDPQYSTLEPWDPTYCTSQYSHIKTLPKNNYLVSQAVDPPEYAKNLLCNTNYNIAISNKIKITIPDDPIFSGTYVFDYTPSFGDGSLFSSNWTLNTAESTQNLTPYNHPDSPLNNKLLVSFSDDHSNGVSPYDGYLEIKTSYYNDENNTGARQLEDVFAFPAEFVFTAVQPPCPCSGMPNLDFVDTVGTGHRLAVGFSPPIRWRHPYKNWIIVDKKSHVIENSVINYATGNVFYDGSGGPYVQHNIYLNNSKYIKYTKSYVPGTAETQIGDGYFSLNATTVWPICTGLSDLGFAFKCSASGLGVDRGVSYYFDNGASIQGLGRQQEFTRDVADNFYGIIQDERPFFDDKVPVKAIIEFVYSCRSGLPCSFVDTPTSVSKITGLLQNSCPSYNFIGTDYLCGNNEQAYPSDSVWTQNGITSTDIIYSGYSGSPFIASGSTYTYRLLPIEISGQITNNMPVNIYDFNPSTINSNILIRSTGGSPTNIRNFLRNNLFIGKTRTLNSDPTSTPIVTSSEYNKWDLYWNIDGNTAKVYVIPDNESISAPSIFVTGAGSSEVNGTYFYNGGYSEPLNGYGNIFIKDNYRLSLSVTGSNVPYQWRIQKLYQNNWVNFYVNTGVYTDVLTYTGTSKIGTVNNKWYANSWCYSGINPPPSSITYYYR